MKRNVEGRIFSDYHGVLPHEEELINFPGEERIGMKELRNEIKSRIPPNSAENLQPIKILLRIGNVKSCSISSGRRHSKPDYIKLIGKILLNSKG